MGLAALWVALPMGVFAGVVFILLLGPLPRFRDTLLDKLHLELTEKFPKRTNYVMVRLCGTRLTRALGSVIHCFCNTGHPFFQIVLVAMFLAGLGVFFRYAWPHIPGPYLPEYHKVPILATIASTIYVYLKCSFSDPGRITHANVDLIHQRFPLDLVIYDPYRCRTCKFVK
ncbi:palmitoyltransferase swf1 [Dispira parvispora]|uniref:Palmitoyltransferase swf1 n=1 Tax=Dispira parvispora TaxID=1520584 RepID=A0A9W8AMD6_9FUNG|nr:palmitoyltransferase swf1 [Dispira parvispora]